MNKYSDDMIRNIISEYVKGQSINKLSNKYNIPYSTIKHWIVKRKVPTNKTSRFYQKYELKGDYAEIFIKSKQQYVRAIIDLDDVEKCKNFGIWSLTKDGYLVNCKTKTYLHRFIMNCPDDMEVDHIYHDLLDNRKSQLRFATSSQQKMNTRIRKDNKSGHRGVYYDKSRNTWNVNLKKEDKRIAKRFKNYDDAVKYCERIIVELQKDFKYKEKGDK